MRKNIAVGQMNYLSGWRIGPGLISVQYMVFVKCILADDGQMNVRYSV